MRKPRQREAKKHAPTLINSNSRLGALPLCSGGGREVVGGEGAGVEETELLSQETGLIFLFRISSSPSCFLLSLKPEKRKKRKASV